MSDPTAAEPVDSFFDYIGEISLDPVSLRRIFLILTRNLYSDPTHYGESNPDFKKFIYCADANECTVQIRYDYDDDPNVDAATFSKSNIYVGVSGFQFNKNVIDKYYSVNDDRSTETFAERVATNIVIRHQAKNPDDVLALGYLTANFYAGIRKKLIDCMHLSIFELNELSPIQLVSQPTEEDRTYQVDLSIDMVFTFTQDISQESHRIKKIALDLSI